MVGLHINPRTDILGDEQIIKYGNVGCRLRPSAILTDTLGTSIFDYDVGCMLSA